MTRRTSEPARTIFAGMHGRSSEFFKYDRMEAFNINAATPYTYFTQARNKLEWVVGIRAYAASEQAAIIPAGNGSVGSTLTWRLNSVCVTLCDAKRVPYIERVPLLRCNSNYIGIRSANIWHPYNFQGPLVPLKIVRTLTRVESCFVFSTGVNKKPNVVVELFYKDRE